MLVRKQKSSLAALLPYLSRYRKQFALGFLLVVATVVTGMFSPWVLKYAIDDLSLQFRAEKLPRYAGLLLAISVLEGILHFWMRRVMLWASLYIEYDLRNDILAHIQRLPQSFFHAATTGNIMSRATNDLASVRALVGTGGLYLTNTVVTFMIATVILVRLNWKLTLVAYVPLLIVVLTMRYFGSAIHDRYENVQEQVSEISTRIHETLSGIRMIKAFAREEHSSLEFEQINRQCIDRNRSLIRIRGVYNPMTKLLFGLASVALIGLGGSEVATGRLTLGELVAFIGYLGLLAWPTVSVAWVINTFQRGAVSMERILWLLPAHPIVYDQPAVSASPAISGALEIRNLTFCYPDSPRRVLEQVSFAVPSGESLAIIGRTGSGKSTLISLLPRLFDPSPGTVFIDGRDVLDWPVAALRQAIGYVPQETFLFSGTIRENILFGRDDTDTKDFDQVARASQISEDVQHFPERYETRVGERGITLSAGQKQRVAISRAVAVKPKILILDDAFSNVDSNTENKIFGELEKVMRGQTTILVSHRIATARRCHNILILDEGRVIERGTHESLLAANGMYADLYRKQLLEEELRRA